MNVSFDAKFDEMVDVATKSLKRAGDWDRQRRDNSIITAAFVGVLIFAVLSSFSISLEARLIFAVLTSIAASVIAFFLFPDAAEKRIRAFYRKRLKGEEPFRVDVQLDTRGITFKQMGSELTHSWETVHRVQPTESGVDFLFSAGTLATVRSRAFSSTAQRDEFVELATSFLRSRSSPTQSAAATLK